MIPKKTSLTVNGLTMSWDEVEDRMPEPCQKCGKLTQGLSVEKDRQFAACLYCAVDILMQRACMPSLKAFKAGVKALIDEKRRLQ